jgi:hypothetical protein
MDTESIRVIITFTQSEQNIFNCYILQFSNVDRRNGTPAPAVRA